MRNLIYDDNHCKVYVEFDPAGRALIHMTVDQFTPHIYRETLADFAVVKEWLKESGVDTIYTVWLAEDKKHRKFMDMYGWTKVGEVPYEDELYAAYEMGTG